MDLVTSVAKNFDSIKESENYLTIKISNLTIEKTENNKIKRINKE